MINIINKRCFRFLAILLVAAFSLSLVAVLPAKAESPDLSTLADKAANYLYNEFIKNGVKNEDAYVGSYATWVLTQAGIDVSAWVSNGTSLKDAVTNLIEQDLAAQNAPAKQLAQDLLVAKALGQQELAEQLLQALKNRDQGTGFDNNIYSDLPAYDLLGRAGDLSVFNTTYAIDYILSQQLTVSGDVYGAWGSSWTDNQGTHYYADFMTTAQAIRALSYLDPENSNTEIQTAISLGLDWLKKQQQPDGSFAASWDDPLTDTVEMVATLKVLKIDPASIKSSSGNSPIDYLLNNALNPDGSFGTMKNAGDATWALWGYQLLGGRPGQLFISPSSTTISVGEKVYFNAAYKGTDVTNDAVWAVADSSVASVVYGLVTGLKAGTTAVTATYGGLTGSANLTVKSPTPPGGNNTCTVEIAVVGMDKELFYGPGSVMISSDNKWGMTVLGALDATGLPYTMSSTWPDFVESISGLANEGMSGWCYTVNDTIPSVAAAKYTVKDGDRIIWYYSKDMNEPPPKWDDLIKQAASGTVSAATAAQQVADLLSGLESGKLTLAEVLDDISDLLDQIKTTEVTDELKGKLADAVAAISPLVASIPEKALSIRTDGDMPGVKIDPQAVKDQVSIIKNAAALAERLEQIEVSGAANLVTDRVVVNLPAEISDKKALTVGLPADALQEIVSANLGLAVNSVYTSLSLPSEVLKEACDPASNLSGLELAVAQMDAAKLIPFRGAGVIGNKAFDLGVMAVSPEGKKEALKGVSSRKVMVTFALDGADLGGKDRSRLAVYRQKQDGSWEFVGGSLSQDGKTFSFETDHLSVYALMEFQNPFKDTANHWAKDAIEQMAMRLIVRGFGDDTFAPDRPLTRAQFAALLVRALGLEQQTPVQPTFRDVAPGYWGYGAIAAAARAGLFKGTGDGNFDPDRPVKREEMATVLAAILKQNDLDPGLTAAQTAALLQGYNDSVQISAWAKDGMAVCINKGIIGGRPNATLAPGDQATRAEAVVVLQKLLQLLGRL